MCVLLFLRECLFLSGIVVATLSSTATTNSNFCRWRLWEFATDGTFSEEPPSRYLPPFRIHQADLISVSVVSEKVQTQRHTHLAPQTHPQNRRHLKCDFLAVTYVFSVAYYLIFYMALYSLFVRDCRCV